MRSTAAMGEGEAGPAFRPANKASVVRGLMADLLLGRWEGGQRLTEKEACERFRMSRTPVREAFLALEGLGFLELRRNCGAVARKFAAVDLGEIYAVRSLLEVEAVRLATGRMAEERLEALGAAFLKLRETGEIDAGWALDRELHGTIAEASGNRRLAAEIGRYGDLIQTVREIVGAQALGIHATTVQEHLAILDALRRGAAAAACRAMHGHLRQAAESAVAALVVVRAGAAG